MRLSKFGQAELARRLPRWFTINLILFVIGLTFFVLGMHYIGRAFCLLALMVLSFGYGYEAGKIKQKQRRASRSAKF